ncbi:MAG: outer membrane beta-barrel domain-containing protein [Bdellovibrionales bacterium]
MKAICKTAAIVVASVGFACSAFAQSEKKESPKKVDVQNLEKRYWAPKDKKFKVVQNRTYTKTKKFSLTVMPSLMLNEEYSKGFGMDLAVGYYFNDRWGLELEYQSMSLDDNDLVDQIRTIGSGSGAWANHGKSTSYYGAGVRWMPFYAKMSFLGTKIVYFDLSLGLNAGIMEYEQQLRSDTAEPTQTSMTFGFDISQSFYMSKKLLLRVDYKHRFYSQEIIEGGTLSTGDFIKDRQEDSISLNLGLTYLL